MILKEWLVLWFFSWYTFSVCLKELWKSLSRTDDSNFKNMNLFRLANGAGVLSIVQQLPIENI